MLKTHTSVSIKSPARAAMLFGATVLICKINNEDVLTTKQFNYITCCFETFLTANIEQMII